MSYYLFMFYYYLTIVHEHWKCWENLSASEEIYFLSEITVLLINVYSAEKSKWPLNAALEQNINIYISAITSSELVIGNECSHASHSINCYHQEWWQVGLMVNTPDEEVSWSANTLKFKEACKNKATWVVSDVGHICLVNVFGWWPTKSQRVE